MELRADAARNRAAIVEAARAVFAEHGLDAPLDEIARRAGTGNATLYRRFPARGDLIAAVFADRMSEHLNAVEAGLADPDAWRGFATYVKAVGAMQARDRGIANLVTMDVSSAPGDRAAPVPRVRRARPPRRTCRRRQHLALHFTTQDVVLLLMANAGLVERAHGITAEASARLIHVLLDGFRASAASDSPAPQRPAHPARNAPQRRAPPRPGPQGTRLPGDHRGLHLIVLPQIKEYLR